MLLNFVLAANPNNATSNLEFRNLSFDEDFFAQYGLFNVKTDL